MDGSFIGIQRNFYYKYRVTSLLVRNLMGTRNKCKITELMMRFYLNALWGQRAQVFTQLQEMCFNVSKESAVSIKLENTKSNKHKTAILNECKQHVSRRFHTEKLHRRRKDKGEHSIHSTSESGKGSFIILCSTIHLHGTTRSSMTILCCELCLQVCTVRGNLRLAAAKITQYN